MSRRPLRDEELRLWARVLTSVRPAPGRLAPALKEAPGAAPPSTGLASACEAPSAGPSGRDVPLAPPQPIEAGRQRRLVRERDPIEARIDLHGYDQDRARRALTNFLAISQARGLRAVLVITGKGSRGGGVLRERAPEWLGEPPIRGWVAGWSPAHRRHGGEGAIYVALKRPDPPKGPPISPAP